MINEIKNNIGAIQRIFSFVVGISAIIGGASVIVYTITQAKIFFATAAVSAIIWGISITFKPDNIILKYASSPCDKKSSKSKKNAREIYRLIISVIAIVGGTSALLYLFGILINREIFIVILRISVIIWGVFISLFALTFLKTRIGQK